MTSVSELTLSPPLWSYCAFLPRPAVGFFPFFTVLPVMAADRRSSLSPTHNPPSCARISL